MDLMIHDLDQARWTCGEVETVYAVQSPPTVDNVVPPFVSAHVTLTHTGGAISHIRATWGALGTPFTTGFSIAGDAGVLRYDSTDNTGLTTSLHGGDRRWPRHPDLGVEGEPLPHRAQGVRRGIRGRA